jgi:hypothetical protein
MGARDMLGKLPRQQIEVSQREQTRRRDSWGAAPLHFCWVSSINSDGRIIWARSSQGKSSTRFYEIICARKLVNLDFKDRRG